MHPLVPTNMFAWTAVVNSATVMKSAPPLPISATRSNSLAPTRPTRMALVSALIRRLATPYVPCLPAPTSAPRFGPTPSITTFVFITLFPTAVAPPVPTNYVAASSPTSRGYAPLDAASTSAPTTARYGRVVPNSRLGIFLGYSRTLKVLYYFDVASSHIKTATHARFDEGMNDLATAPPNVQALRLLSPDGVVPADRPILSPSTLR
jgi:hypothetical protein